MIFDSQDQKEFIFKIMRSYVCSYGESLGISQNYAPAIQAGEVVDITQQKKLLKSNGNKPEKTKSAPAGSEA